MSRVALLGGRRQKVRFLAGITLGPRRSCAGMLDRLMIRTRRILGALPPAVVEQIAQANAVPLYGLRQALAAAGGFRGRREPSPRAGPPSSPP